MYASVHWVIIGPINALSLAPTRYMDQGWIIVNWIPEENFIDILIKIEQFLYTKMNLEM